MSARRTLLAAAGGAAVGVAGLLAASAAGPDHRHPAWTPHAMAAAADPSGFPDVELQTHDGRTVRFYEDLVRGKTVALNFMYVACTKF